jgi:chromosome segregation ATPase
MFLAFGVQYLFFGNIRDLERRLEDFDMTISTLKKQQINDKGILHDMVKKFKSEMRNKDDEKTKLKELTNKEDSAASDVSSGNEKLNELEEAKATLEFKYKTIEDVDTIKPNTFNKGNNFIFLT